MKECTIQVSDEVLDDLQIQSEAEGFPGPEQYLAARLTEEWCKRKRSEIEALLLESLDEVERGESTPFPPDYFEKLKAELREKHGSVNRS